MRFSFSIVLLALLWFAGNVHAVARPNVVLISVDDLNDWVGCLGGHPQALTPNMDRFAKRGVLFRNAHCQSPVCMPSRASLMVSRWPSSTGLYFLNPGLRNSQVTKNEKTMPEAFADAGYQVMGVGKLFHYPDNRRVFGRVGEYGGSFGGNGPRPKKKISQPHGHPLWDWGAFPEQTSTMPDFKIASWATDKLKKKYDKPYFLAVGFYRPHVPLYAPKKWFDMHPLKKVKLPLIKDDDVNDLSTYARNLVTLKHVAPEHAWVKKSGQWAHAVQSYLATITFADHCVGMVLDALDARSDANNTIICLFSDHGFHLGEKQRWAKRSLWEDGTRVPLIFAGPKIKAGSCKRPVGLIDIYPTLLDLCGEKANPRHEGQSLKPLLADPARQWKRPTRTTFGPGNHSIRSTRWRYIRYVDGSEELYDHKVDPNEWTNLAKDPKLKDVLAEHRRWLPKTEKPILGRNSTGHKAYKASAAALKK